MAVKTKIVKRKQEIVESVTCDGCGKEVKIDDADHNDIFEAQEFIRINHSCGYTSIFGDCNTLECDLCQDCVQKLLGHVIRIQENQC